MNLTAINRKALNNEKYRIISCIKRAKIVKDLLNFKTLLFFSEACANKLINDIQINRNIKNINFLLYLQKNFNLNLYAPLLRVNKFTYQEP